MCAVVSVTHPYFLTLLACLASRLYDIQAGNLGRNETPLSWKRTPIE